MHIICQRRISIMLDIYFLRWGPKQGGISGTRNRNARKAHECEFGDTCDERILEPLIQTIENEQLMQKCISKSWTLQQFLSEGGQIEDISIQVHDIKVDPEYQEIAKVMSRRSSQISRHPEYGGPVENCTYCGLTRMRPWDKHSPANGTQCNSYNQQKKPSIKISEDVYSISDTSSDEDLIEKSLVHMRVKTVSESTEEKRENGLSGNIQLLHGKISGLENELKLTKIGSTASNWRS